MPIYEYRCTLCGERFSLLQPVGADKTIVHCPKCETTKVDRLLSSFASGSSKSGADCPSASTCSSGFT
jgi:putative FmdB family regulatory protein